jgi:glycosyltransferase involved in cell wall biosynthesis
MKIELILDFKIPIWRFYLGGNYNIPWSFEYNEKQYKNGICIIHLAWDAERCLVHDPSFISEIKICKYLNPIICFPTQEGVELCRKLHPKLNSCLASHNSFIDENLFKIDLNQKIEYDMFVSSAFAKYKNLHLLENISNVIGVGYGHGPDYIFFHPKNVKILNFTDKNNTEVEKERTQENYRRIQPDKIAKYINSSKIGGIFSTDEGSCYSSGEYLLCGIPVLSCKCRGGRETFYDNNNSELCEPNRESVKHTLNKMLNKYDNGLYNREAIRNNHIKIMTIQRNNLSEAVLNIMQRIIPTQYQPSIEELTESLKHYHSNNQCYEYPPSYKRQTSRELTGLRILKLI